MWLDRLTAQSRETTPSPGPNRSYSPTPRRSTQLGPSTAIPRRPGIQPRSSSLSVASLYASNESLPGVARSANGSALRNQLTNVNGSDRTEPLDVLKSILGPLQHDVDDTIQSSSIDYARRAANLTAEDFGGLSLEEIVSENSRVIDDDTSPDVAAIGLADDFEKERGTFEDLHKSIAACDEVLASVETYLASFQADLAAVSNEIESLQERSAALNTRLQNRKVVEKLLGPEVEALIVPPPIVKKLTEGVVDEQWLKALQELDKKSRSIDAKLKEGKEVKAAQDMKPFLNDISNKAVERIRDYVVSQIRAIRSPSINAQVIQNDSFLRYKDIFAFLSRQQPQLAEEISQAYVNTIRWYYLHNFTRYKTAVEKLNVHTIDQNDLIAADVGGKKIVRPGPPRDIFSIGRRAEILHTAQDLALPSFAAEDDKGTHFLEVPFRTLNIALVDNASAEYSFLSEFFSKQPQQATNRRFTEIFQPSFDLGLALTKQLIDPSVDALGMLICVRLTQRFAFELQRRKIPAGEGYVNATRMLLWPRFQMIIDAHCESIRRATASLPGRPQGSALGLSTSMVANNAAQTTAPHVLTQRFAHFVQGILVLSSEAGDDEPVSNSVGRLRAEVEAFLLKLSKGIADARKRDRFLFNNYSLIGTIIADTQGRFAEEMQSHFAELTEILART